jgi:hypothetical protein
MNAHHEYMLRSLADEALTDLIGRLERQVATMRQSATSLGLKLADQYAPALAGEAGRAMTSQNVACRRYRERRGRGRA